MKELRPISTKEFYATPRAGGGASSFAEEIRNLAITDVAATGHSFRLRGNDPTALRIDEERRKRGKGPVPEKINFTIDYLPAVFLALGAERSRAVALIEADGKDFEDKEGRWSGTGFLVHDNLLLTNHHVLNSVVVAKNARAIFNFEVGPDQKPAETAAFKLDPDRLFVTSPLTGGLDYTFVWIDEAASKRFGTITLKRSAFTIQVGDRANIVQHPRGTRKQIVLQDNEVIRDTGFVLHYTSDTDVGSSGSPVFDNRWHLIALHHATDRNRDGLKAADDRPPPPFLNEGIKMSAIAADLERRVATAAEGDGPGIALAAFTGVDSLMGYFGGLGRPAVAQPSTSSTESAREVSTLNKVVDIYSGENRDLDVSFWNVEGFADRYQDKVVPMAGIVADLNLDIWALADVSGEAAKALIRQIKADYGLDFGAATAAGPGAPGEQRTTAVIWNTATVTGKRLDWPNDIGGWFDVDSRQFAELRRAAVPGPVFDDRPGLFVFSVSNRQNAGLAPFEIRLVSLQAKAKGAGQRRRRMAGTILAAAIAALRNQGHGSDWLIIGDYDAAAAAADFHDRLGDDLVCLSAAGEGVGAVTCLRSPQSLTDRILLSPGLTRTLGADDLFVVASAQRLPEYFEKIAVDRPALVRLCLADQLPAVPPPPPSLLTALGRS